MDYKLWEDAGFGINGQQQPVQKNRGFFDALSDFASGTWANTSSMMDSTDLHKLREELLHPVAGTTPEEYEALKQQYRDLYNEQQQTRLAGQQAQNRLKQDGKIGEFAAYATNVGGSLPSIGLNLVGHATGSFPITNVLGSYMDAESAAIEASEKVLSDGGTLEQAEIAFKNALPKQIATTIPDTVVDQVIWGGMGKKLGLGKGAIDSAKRFASQLKDPATRIGSEVAFKTGKRFIGKGAGVVADSLMNIISENGQEGSQNYVSDVEAARAMGQDVDYSLGGFKDSLLSKEGIETAKGTTAATLLTSLIGGSIKSGQYLSRGAETDVGVKAHNAFSGMQNEKGIKLDPQARAEQEMILSKLRGFSREELASWSDADIVAESAVAMGDMRKNITGEGSDISQIREAVDTVARLSKDQNSITKEGEITEETRDLLTRMGLDEKDINDWFTSPTDVLAKARQVEQEEQAKQKQAEQEGEKPKTTIKVSPETGETLNVKQGEVVQGQKPTEQTTDTQEQMTEKTTQNGLGEQAKQAEQQGTIQQDEEVEYPDSIIGWERDYDADNRDGVEYEGATYYSLKDNSISARIEPVGNGFTVIKVDEQGNATSDSKNKNFPSLKAAIDYLQQNKGETVFQESDETQAEMPSDGVDATKGNSGTLVGSVEDLYNLSQQEPDLINPYEFAEFVRIKQHMGAGDLDVYFDRRKGYTLGEDGQWHEVNASATPAATAKGRAIIQLYKGGDLGSAIHEIAHTAYWKLSDADKRTFGYYAIKTQGKYIADSLDEDYTPEFENRLLKLASKVSQNVELDEQDKQLQEKILSKAATNQIYDNLITFYNSKMNGGAVDLKNLTPQQQRAIEERWAWEMSQWYIEGYSVGVAPSNIIQRIAQRGCESIAKDLNSLARIWQHIHHKDNNEIENIYRGGQAEQQQEQAEQTPNINVQFTNELERQAMPNVNMPMNFGGEQAIQYGVPTLGESYNDAQEYANLYNELERRYANRQKMQGLPSTDGSIPTVQNRPTQTEEKKTTTGYKEAIPTTKTNREEEKLVDIIKNRKSGWEKALERLAEINPKTFRNILYSEAATQGEQVNGQGLTNQNESGIVEQKKEVADNGETENTRGTEDLQGNVGEVQGRGAVRTGDDNRTGEGRIQQETVEGSSEGNGKDIPLLKNTKFKSVYNKREEKKTEIKDWRDLSDSNQTKQVYVDALNASKEANEDYGVYVSEQTVESLKDCKVVLHKNKMAGFAITPDGNIVGVFSNPKNPIRGVLNDMIFIARMMGGNSMDCFGDFLLYGYRACGFTPVARTSFDETYYPADNPANNTIRKEKPDVFFLVKDNDNNTTYLNKMNNGEYKNNQIAIDDIPLIDSEDSYGDALGFQGQVLEEIQKKENKDKSTKEVADSLRPKEDTVTETQETTEQTQAEQTETNENKKETKVEKPTVPTDEIYSHLYFGDKTGKLKYNPKTKKIEYFVEEAGGRDPITLRKTYKLVNKGEITPEQYNELRQKYEQDFRKAKGEKKENAPDLVEGMKKEDYMYSAYKETKRTEKEKEDTIKELGKENQGLVTGKSEGYARQNAAEESFNKAMKEESLSEMEETELTKEQKKEVESSVEQELPKVEKKKTEETKKTTTKPKTIDYLSALHKKYKNITGTPIGEKGYRFKEDEKAFIEGFKGMIDGAIGNKEELVNVAKRLDSWFQNDPTERNRMVRKYLSQYLADAAKINAKQDTDVNNQLSDKAQEAQNILDKAFPNTRFQFAWHGSGYNFNRFTLEHIGEGEGAAAHGWGLYFGKDWTTGEKYANVLQRKGHGEGYIYKVEVPDDIKLLSEDGLLKNNSKEVIEKLKKVYDKYFSNSIYSGVPFSAIFNRWSGKKFMIELDDIINSENKKNGIKYIKGKSASLALKEFGIDGHHYIGGLDGKCCVIWNDQAVKLLEKYDRESGKTTKNMTSNSRFQLNSKEGMEESDTNSTNKNNKDVRFQAVAVKDTKALESKYEQDFLKVGKQMGYTENEISHAFILYATGNTNINIDTSKENNKAERIFVKINNKINNDLWKSGQNVQRGLDGKWRTYIDDRKATLKSGILKLLNEPNKIKGKTFYLGQIISHLDLYKYNKKLKGVKVLFKDFGSKSNKLGQVTENGTIELNYRKMNTEKNLMSTLLHEIQHIIQKNEGFARGGNGESFLDPRNQTLFSALTKNILNDVEKIVKFAQDNEYPLTQKQADKILNMDEFEFEKYLNENSTIGVILNDYIELKNKKFDLYKNLLGEIEARDTSLRYGLDDEHYNKIKPLDLDYQYRKLKENRNNVTVRFQKSDENQEKKLTKKQEKKLEIQKEIKEAKEKGQMTDTYKDVYSVSFTKSAQESKVNQEKMKYFDERKSAWERHEADGRVTYTRTTPFEHHQKVITYNGINDKIVEKKPKKKYRELLDFIKEKITKNLFNDQYALYKLATDMGLGDTYMRMIVTQGYVHKTGVALENGIKYNGKRTRGLNEIAREIGEEKQPAFCEYAIAKHLQDIYNRPKNKIEQKYNKDEVDAVIKRVEASEDYELFERCRKDLVEYNHAVFHVLLDGGIITEQEFQKYIERDKNYVPLAKLMDKEDFGFNSIQYARSMINVGSPIKTLGSSKREIKNIFAEMQKRTAIYYAAASRNKAGQIFVNEICNNLDKMYDGDTVSRGASVIRKVKVKTEDGKLITRPDADKQIFYINNGGKHEFYQVSDPEIYRALRHLDEEQLHIINGMLEKILSAPASLIRATATSTPDFGIRNLIRDNITAFYTSEHGFIPLVDALWGMREIKRNGEFYQKYIDQVGDYGLKGRGKLLKNNTYKPTDYRESLKDEIKKNYDILVDSKRSLKDRTNALLKMTIGAPFFAAGKQIETFNMYLEQGTRVGEFKNAKMGYNGLIDRITSDLTVDIKNTRQSDIISAYKAQDVTLYFAQHGLLGGKFNRFVTFLNASLLGAQKFLNAVDLAVTGKNSMNQKNTRLQKEMLFKVVLNTAFAIGLSVAGHGDEDYDEAPEYEKDTFWIFPDGFRLSKDEIYGRTVGTAIQRAIDQYYKEGKIDVLKTFEAIASVFKPSTIMPAVLDMFYGAIYNKDSFTGREIVPEYMIHKVGYQQKDIYTGNFAADFTEVLYKAFGINLSAKRVDWALQKNLTNAKKYIDAVYDIKEKYTDPEHFNEKMARGYDKNDSTGKFIGGLRDDVPPILNLITGTFATNRSQYQSISDFEKKYYEIKQIADNDKDIPMTPEQKRKWKKYQDAYKQYTKLRKQLKAIRSNASLNKTEKREKAQPIFEKQKALAKWAEG